MADMIQTIQFTEPGAAKIPMPHYSDKVLSTHAVSAWDGKTVNLSYVAPNLTRVSTEVNRIVNYSNKFMAGDSFTDIPTDLSVTIAVDQPIEWSVTYQYPQTFDDYMADAQEDFGRVIAPLAFTSHYIFAYSLSLSLANIRFAQSATLRGLKFSPASYNIRLSLFQESGDPAALIPNYFIINRNPNDEVFRLVQTETVDGTPIWDYNWSGTLQ